MLCTAHKYNKYCIVSQYINAISLVYNVLNTFISIIDNNKENFLFLLDAVCKLQSSNSHSKPSLLNDFNVLHKNIITAFKAINQKIFQSKKINKL